LNSLMFCPFEVPENGRYRVNQGEAGVCPPLSIEDQ